MTDKFISVSVAPWHKERLTKQSKTGLREMLAKHEDTEFVVHSINHGTYTTIGKAAQSGAEEITVLGSDATTILGVIVPKITTSEKGGNKVEVVVK